MPATTKIPTLRYRTRVLIEVLGFVFRNIAHALYYSETTWLFISMLHKITRGKYLTFRKRLALSRLCGGYDLGQLNKHLLPFNIFAHHQTGHIQIKTGNNNEHSKDTAHQ